MSGSETESWNNICVCFCSHFGNFNLSPTAFPIALPYSLPTVGFLIPISNFFKRSAILLAEDKAQNHQPSVGSIVRHQLYHINIHIDSSIHTFICIFLYVY